MLSLKFISWILNRKVLTALRDMGWSLLIILPKSQMFETDTVVKDNKDDFEKYISYNYNYIDSVIEVNGKFILKRLYQFYHILSMSIAELRF